MKILTIKEFKSLLTSDGWTHKQINRSVKKVTHSPDGELEAPQILGKSTLTSKLGGLEIKYTEQWSYDENQPGSFCANDEGEWEFKGLKVIAGNGDDIDADDACSGIKYDMLYEFYQLFYTDIDSEVVE